MNQKVKLSVNRPRQFTAIRKKASKQQERTNILDMCRAFSFKLIIY